jgi:hypothetical protein
MDDLKARQDALKKELASRPPYAYVSFNGVDPAEVTLDGSFTAEDLVRIVALLERTREAE